MTPEVLFRIWDRFDASDASELVYETEEGKLCLRRPGAGADHHGERSSADGRPLPEKGAFRQETPEKTPEQKGRLVKAPLVGTFYRAPAPGERPFVRIGQSVKKGETLGIIEAMKMMNEITAPCDGVVETILVEDETLVEYDQGLMRIGEEHV